MQDGRDISRLPAIKRDYGIVFQSYALFPNLTIHDNVAYGLVNRRAGRKAIAARVAELLKLVGLPDAGRQVSRAAVRRPAAAHRARARARHRARTACCWTSRLSALDAIERVRLRGEIRALQQRLRVTTIMVTHDQEEALSMADRIVVMKSGRIEQVGTPREIYETPATPFVADFVGKINVLSAVAEGGGRFRVGVAVAPGRRARMFAVGTAVKLYLRPEEIGAARQRIGAVGHRSRRISRRSSSWGRSAWSALSLDAADVPCARRQRAAAGSPMASVSRRGRRSP